MSTPALAAIAACLAPAALADASAAAAVMIAERNVLLDGLAEIGLPAAGRPDTPFVLVDTSGIVSRGDCPGSVREALREKGFAVRRGDTFPGLGPDWIRIAVRGTAVSRRLLETLAALGATNELAAAKGSRTVQGASR